MSRKVPSKPRKTAKKRPAKDIPQQARQAVLEATRVLDAELSSQAAPPAPRGVDPQQFSEASQRFRQSAHELIGLTTSGLQSAQTQELAQRLVSGAHDALDMFVDLLSALPKVAGASEPPPPRRRSATRV